MKFAKRKDRFGEGIFSRLAELKKAIEAIDKCGILKKQMGV